MEENGVRRRDAIQLSARESFDMTVLVLNRNSIARTGDLSNSQGQEKEKRDQRPSPQGIVLERFGIVDNATLVLRVYSFRSFHFLSSETKRRKRKEHS